MSNCFARRSNKETKSLFGVPAIKQVRHLNYSAIPKNLITQLSEPNTILDTKSPYSLLRFCAFGGIIISTDPEYKGIRSIIYDNRKKYCRFKKK